MAVQILIHRDNGKVVFDSPQGVQQSDLVFWHNADNETHYPIPDCGALKVAPGQTTASSPYQGFPDATAQLPLTVDYTCALHAGESGTVVIGADATSPPAGAAAVDPQAVPIHIRRTDGGVTFETVDVAQGDTVYWVNDDTQEHWPVPNCTGLCVAPGQSSNGAQLATGNAPRSPFTNPALTTTGPSPLPMGLTYGCAIPGHENESGTFNIYDNLALVEVETGVAPPTVTTIGIPVIVATGGKSPYTITQDPAHPELTLAEQPPAGSSAGVAVSLNQATKVSGTVALQVKVTDALNKTLDQSIQIVIQEG